MEHNIGRLYTLERRLNNISKDESRQMKAVTESVQDFVNWKKQARHQLELLLSLQRFDEVSLRPELLESFETKKYIYEQIVIQTERDVELPLSFFAPKKNKKEKCPIVLYFCGNYIKKTESASLGDFDYIKKSLDKQDNSFIVRLVKQGYAVAVVDTGWKAGKIEVTGKADSDKSNTVMLHERLSKIALTLGYSLSGMNVWDGIKVIDYLKMRKEFDGRLYCGGESDGGMTSLYLAAIDERIKGSFVSSCFYGVQIEYYSNRITLFMTIFLIYGGTLIYQILLQCWHQGHCS